MELAKPKKKNRTYSVDDLTEAQLIEMEHSTGWNKSELVRMSVGNFYELWVSQLNAQMQNNHDQASA